ncbi:hypothetical protein ACLOJK_040733 [Asimina triloba]
MYCIRFRTHTRVIERQRGTETTAEGSRRPETNAEGSKRTETTAGINRDFPVSEASTASPEMEGRVLASSAQSNAPTWNRCTKMHSCHWPYGIVRDGGNAGKGDGRETGGRKKEAGRGDGKEDGRDGQGTTARGRQGGDGRDEQATTARGGGEQATTVREERGAGVEKGTTARGRRGAGDDGEGRKGERGAGAAGRGEKGGAGWLP